MQLTGVFPKAPCNGINIAADFSDNRILTTKQKSIVQFKNPGILNVEKWYAKRSTGKQCKKKYSFAPTITRSPIL
jgi:hypothetical protein